MSGKARSSGTAYDNKLSIFGEAFRKTRFYTEILFQFTCTASNEISKSSTFILLDHNNTCCAQPSAGGLSTGVVVLLIILGAFAVIGIPLVYFVFSELTGFSFI